MPYYLPSLSHWDVLLILAVSLQTLILAYRPSPRGKALLLSLPVPFTLAVLAVGLKVGASNVLGLALLFLFTHAVRIFHYRLKTPIVPSIGLALAGYCVMGWCLNSVLPATATAFWFSAGGVMAAALALYIALPYRSESTAPTPLPVWQKLPMVVAVICGLIALKGALQGFATMFPMVGVVAAYESRRCLWTMGRQIPVIMLSMAPMIVTVYLAQDTLGVGYALALGWVVYLAVFTPLFLARQREGSAKGSQSV